MASIGLRVNEVVVLLNLNSIWSQLLVNLARVSRVLRGNVGVSERRVTIHRFLVIIVFLFNSFLRDCGFFPSFARRQSIHVLAILKSSERIWLSLVVFLIVWQILLDVFLFLSLLRLELLLCCDDLVYFIDELLTKIYSLQILGVFSKYFQEELYVSLVWELKSLLDYGRYRVVAVLIQHYVSEQILLFRRLSWCRSRSVDILVKKHVKNNLLALGVWVIQQNFHNTRWILGGAVSQQILADDSCYLKVDGLIVEIDHFRDNVIRKLVIYQFFHILDHLVYKLTLLLKRACLQASLHHTATLLVLGNLQRILDDRLINGLFMLVFYQNVKAGLDHMVSVDVYWELVNIISDSLRELLRPLHS